MYKLLSEIGTGAPIETVKRLSDNAFIPFDPANTDYQAYLKWLEEGNSPIPSDNPASPDATPAEEQ
jgi:hypothetical protein